MSRSSPRWRLAFAWAAKAQCAGEAPLGQRRAGAPHPNLPRTGIRCRKKKAVHKTTSTDDKRLQNTLKRLGVNTIPGIEEVLLISADGTALQFNNPKVQASISANTYVVSGPSQSKSESGAAGWSLLTFSWPSGVRPACSPSKQRRAQLAGTQDVMASMLAGMGGMASLEQMLAAGGSVPAYAPSPQGAGEAEEDEDVPELVGETFS